MGKTRYVDQLLQRVRADGWITAATNCASLGDLSAPLASWRELADDLASQLGEDTCASLGGAAWAALSDLLADGYHHWSASTAQLLDLMLEVTCGLSRHAPWWS